MGRESPWSETAAGTNAGATASHAADSDRTHVMTHISGHVDEAAVIQVLGGAAGATVLAEFSVDTVVGGQNAADVEADAVSFEFTGTWVGDKGIKLDGTIANSNADCQANTSGYSIP